jgi:uncharacterized phage protein gp47/JayE
MASTQIPVPYVDAAGFHLPSDADVVAGLQAAFRGIYGQDILFDNSDQDTQWLGIIASALRDAYTMALSTYNAYSPATAQGVGLSSIVKTNGITRKTASFSTATVTVIGQPRTYSGIVVSDGTYQWALPANFTIPASGSIDLTATCSTVGGVTAAAGTISEIVTPTLGLQSISNPSPASPGAAVETDAALRVRQGQSVTLPSQTVTDGIVAAILALPDVTSCTPFENDTDTVDANDIPAHGTAYVVEGGDTQAIAEAIALKKTQGSPTYGTTSAIVSVGKAQIPRRISFFRPNQPIITVYITVKALAGYTLDAEAALQSAVASFINSLGVGTPVVVNDLYEPVLTLLIGGARPYRVVDITIARDGATPAAADVPIAFNERAFTSSDYILVAAS